VRVVGIVLVVLGALALGYQGLVYAAGEPAAAGRGKAVWIPPVAAGIALVSGLLMIVISGRQEPA
jgi:hypothetical protein